jgi:spore cortex formation protein SpoVR/YcgB (stage V sporulation)
MELEEDNGYETCKFVASLWGYPVAINNTEGDTLFEIDPDEFA